MRSLLRRPAFITGLFLLAGFFGAGCGGIDSGTVVRHEHQPENTYFMMMPIQTGSVCSGNPPTCTPIYGMFPFWIHDDEDFVLHLRDGDKKGSVTVSREVYEATKDGEHYGKPEGYKADKNQSVMSKKKPPADEFESSSNAD
jgi:hypothetical protein